MTAPDPTVVADIVGVANSYGLDPRLAVADAQHESGLSPTAVGDNGTSFGLFQLHEGGELGNLTPAQACDPVTNATVALGVMSQVAKAHPGADPGTIAALAERPANPTAYAQAVDQLYSDTSFLPSITPSTTAAGVTPASLTSIGGSQILNGLTGGVSGVTSGLLGGLTSGVQSDIVKGGAYIVFLAAGAGLIVLGVTRLASHSTTIRQAGQAATQAAAVAAA